MKLSSHLLFLFLFFIFPFTVFANNIAVTDSQHCAKMQGIKTAFMLVLKRGELIKKAILQCANDANLSGASLQGLGALENPSLNYYNFKTKKYQEKTFPGIFELISLSGDIAFSKGKRVIHLHVGLGDDEYHMFGGHLTDALIGITGEITVIPFQGQVNKQMDKATGLELISPSVK